MRVIYQQEPKDPTTDRHRWINASVTQTTTAKQVVSPSDDTGALLASRHASPASMSQALVGSGGYDVVVEWLNGTDSPTASSTEKKTIMEYTDRHWTTDGPSAPTHRRLCQRRDHLGGSHVARGQLVAGPWTRGCTARQLRSSEQEPEPARSGHALLCKIPYMANRGIRTQQALVQCHLQTCATLSLTSKQAR